MGLDIFFAEDIRNALLAADEASSSTARACTAMDVDGDGRDAPTACLYLRAYLEGYRAALTTMALAFGLSPGVVLKSCVRVGTDLHPEAGFHYFDAPDHLRTAPAGAGSRGGHPLLDDRGGAG